MTFRKILTIAHFSALAFLPCVFVSANDARPAIMSYETVGLGSKSGCEKRALMVVNDATEWKRVWGVHTSGDSEAPSLPKVDFAKQTVIALLAGTQPGGKTIQVAQIVKIAGEVKVFYLIGDEEMGWGEKISTGPSQPFHFAVVEKTETPVRFIDALIGDNNCRKCGG